MIGIGDLVRMKRGDLAGKVGRVERYAHPASPWRFVAYSLPGERPFWGSAFNEDDVETVPSLLSGSASSKETP